MPKFVLQNNNIATGTNTFSGTTLATGGITGDVTGNLTGNVTGNVTGTVTGYKRPITDSATTGATVVLTATQTGQVFNNASTGGSPSWTLPTNVNGLWYTFTVSNVTTGFTVTGGTIKAKASATGAAISGTTLTNTQATAVIGDTITLVADGTVWRMVSQSGIFAAS